MDIYEYTLKEHPQFSNQIIYFLNNKDSIVFGGFVRSLLSNTKWNKELDIICYSYKEILNQTIQIFPPNSIKDIDIHTILNYDNGYSIDISKPFETNDFSFNALGLIGENIVAIPNMFSKEIAPILHQIDNKCGFESKMCPNNKERKLKYKDWKIIRR